MTARILVVDDLPVNVKLLEARLTAEYFDVVTANTGMAALEILEKTPCDLILLDVMMPEMDGFETCRRIKANQKTQHIPVVIVTALDQPADRVNGLEAGADDFLTKPISDIAMLTRVRSLVRLKQLTDELRLRTETTQEMGINLPASSHDFSGERGRILLVDDKPTSYERLMSAFRDKHHLEIETNPQEGLLRASEGVHDLIIVNLGLKDFDGLRLCSQIRSVERLRHLPILIIVEPDEQARLMRGLEMGVNDYLVRPIDRNELYARVATQIRRKRYTDYLRDTVQFSLEQAITDPLTGLHNRRYMESHLGALVTQTAARGKDLSLLVLDIDHFKAINDTHGHDAGDDVLREFARRMKKAVRGIDLVCRMGGEEFVVVMPEADISIAYTVAERIREKVAVVPFPIHDGTEFVQATISIGVAMLKAGDTAEQLLKRADSALYAAKRNGRNRVVADAA
ncbi:MAG: PleD family two-component system response regulator [Pseudomonadota bacterium]